MGRTKGGSLAGASNLQWGPQCLGLGFCPLGVSHICFGVPICERCRGCYGAYDSAMPCGFRVWGFGVLGFCDSRFKVMYIYIYARVITCRSHR